MLFKCLYVTLLFLTTPPPSDSGGINDSLTYGDTVYLNVPSSVQESVYIAYINLQEKALQVISTQIPAIPVSVPVQEFASEKIVSEKIKVVVHDERRCWYLSYADDTRAAGLVSPVLRYCQGKELNVLIFAHGKYFIPYSEIAKWNPFKDAGARIITGSPQYVHYFDIKYFPALVIQDTLDQSVTVYEGYLQ